MRLPHPLLLASFGVLVAAASCTLITDVDRSKIPDGTTAGAPSSGGDSSVTPSGGSGGSGGGTAGTGGVPVLGGAGGAESPQGGADAGQGGAQGGAGGDGAAGTADAGATAVANAGSGGV